MRHRPRHGVECCHGLFALLEPRRRNSRRTWVKIAVDAGRLAAAFPCQVSELQIDGSYIIFNGAPQRILKTFGLSRFPQDTICKDRSPPLRQACVRVSLGRKAALPSARS